MDICAELTRLEFSGQARGRHAGKLVYAWGGLPEETVTARVTRRKRRSLSCVVTDVHTPSADRVAPRETHYLSCSPWQVLAESREPDLKATLVRDLFERQFRLVLPEFSVLTEAFFGYRNKLEFSFLDTPAGLSLAFFERESYRHKTPLDGCLLGAGPLNATARQVCEVLRSAEVAAVQLKSLVVRCTQAGQVAAALYVTEPIPPVCGRITALPCISGMRVFLSNPRSPAAVADRLLEEAGTAVLEERILGRGFRYSDRSFFQVNIPLYEHAVRDIRQFVPLDAPVYDLYAGVGTLGICAGGPQTVFVESDAESVGFLRENCERNRLDGAEIRALPVEKALDAIPGDATVILDPPRAGLHPRLLKRLLSGLPRRIVYLSCNPQTQGQDLAALVSYYNLSCFRAYNFFPRTPRVETLAVLERTVAS